MAFYSYMPAIGFGAMCDTKVELIPAPLGISRPVGEASWMHIWPQIYHD